MRRNFAAGPSEHVVTVGVKIFEQRALLERAERGSLRKEKVIAIVANGLFEWSMSGRASFLNLARRRVDEAACLP